MVRNIIAVILGLVVATLVIMSIQMISYSLYPMPEGIDPTDTEAMRTHVQSLPPMAFLIVLLSYFMGTLIGVIVAIKVADTHHKQLALGIATVLMILGIINLFQITHPMWFNIICVLLFIPTALLGYQLAKPKLKA